MNYFLISNKMFKDHTIGTYGKVLFAVLNRFAGKTGTCFPSRRTISKLGNFCVSSYNKYINKLLGTDLVDKIERFRKNRSQTSNLFKLKRGTKNNFAVRSDIFDFKLGTYELCVYFCLAKYKAEDGFCRVSQSQIAMDCDMSVSSVVSAVKILRKAGLIETQEQSNLYDNGNYVLLYKIIESDENVIPKKKKRFDASKLFDTLGRYKEVEANEIFAHFTPMHDTHSPYAYDTPPEVYLY